MSCDPGIYTSTVLESKWFGSIGPWQNWNKISLTTDFAYVSADGIKYQITEAIVNENTLNIVVPTLSTFEIINKVKFDISASGLYSQLTINNQ